MEDSGVFMSADHEAVGRFVDRFDLGRFVAAGCVFEGIQRHGNSVRIQVRWQAEGADFGSGAVSVVDGRVGDAYAKSRNLGLSFVGQVVTRPYAVLMASIAARAGHMTIDDLFALTGLVEHVEEAASEAEPSRPYNPMIDWGAEDAWRHFTCDAAMDRRFREAFEFDSNASFIVHGDLECRFVSPGARIPLPGFFVYPFDLFTHRDAVGPVTDLSDQDVIVDSAARIEAKVRTEMAGRTSTGPVVILSTCVPVVIAEDPGLVLARLAEVCPEGISYVTPTSPEAPSEIYMKSFHAVRATALGRAPEPLSVGMVGYRPGRARDELEGLLAGAGISVTGAIVPLVTRPLLDATLSAKCIVVAPSLYHADTYETLLQGAWNNGRVRLEPEFPWGFCATRAWLNDVCGAFDMREAAGTVFDADMQRCADRISECRRDLGESAFIFVCDADGLDRLVSPLSEAGMPLLPAMCDLGLRSRVLLYASTPKAAAEAQEAFEHAVKAIPSRALVEMAVFGSESELAAQFMDKSSCAVYSEMSFDYRATRAGLPTFSTRIFEPGIEGGVRTLDRFRRLARLPFYRRYHGCLQDSGQRFLQFPPT